MKRMNNTHRLRQRVRSGRKARSNARRNALGFTAACALAFAFAPAAQACDMVGAYIVNLSQDEQDKATGNSCIKSSESATQACITEALRDNIEESCLKRIDIFVPGTNQEHGAWKQMNHLFKSDNDRAHLSVRYEDVRSIDTFVGRLDQAKYDQGVADAFISLGYLLDTLQERFEPEEIRVFGHSKGAHSVAAASQVARFSNVKFFSFAQPGRTGRPLFDGALPAAPLGRPGYIEKMRDNLVTITFRNDEVHQFTEAGATVPERWEFPGWIRESRSSGGNPAKHRIDHHNNYGGFYTDGRSSNDWREGEGAEATNRPYCATGDKSAMDESECSKTQVTFAPWFWGSPECQAAAFAMMEDPNPRIYYIGYSGPREPGSCRDTLQWTRATFRLEYRFNLSDEDCRYNLRIRTSEWYTDKEGGRITVSAKETNDSVWETVTGEINVPYHMRLKVGAWLVQDSNDTFPNCDTSRNSEVWIRLFRLRFDHPATGASDTVTVIGYKEGRGADLIGETLDQFENVGWVQPNKSRDELRMRWGSVRDSIRIDGDGRAGNNGDWYKRVHLVD